MSNVKIVGCLIDKNRKNICYIEDKNCKISGDTLIVNNGVVINKALILDAFYNIVGVCNDNKIIRLGKIKNILQSYVNNSHNDVRFFGYNLNKDIPSVCDIIFCSIDYCRDFINTGLYTDGVIIADDCRLLYVIDKGKIYTAKEYISKKYKLL